MSETCPHEDWIVLCVWCGEVIADSEVKVTTSMETPTTWLEWKEAR